MNFENVPLVNIGHFRIIADEISATGSVQLFRGYHVNYFFSTKITYQQCTNKPSVFWFYRSHRSIRRNMTRNGTSKVRLRPVPFSKPIHNS